MKKVSVSKLPVTSAAVFGREKELALLHDAWRDEKTSMVTVTAWGGTSPPRGGI